MREGERGREMRESARARAIESASEVREMREWLRRCTPRDFLYKGCNITQPPNNPSLLSTR